MDETQKALSRIKTRLATLEMTLKKRVHNLLNVLPPDEHGQHPVSPSPSMNSTFGEQPSLMSTPANASTVIRRAAQKSSTNFSMLSESSESGSRTSLLERRSRDARHKPFFIMEDLRKLVETYRSYDTMAEEMVAMLDEDSEPYLKALRKREHYNEVVMDIIDNIENRIWELCSVQQSPLPGQNAEELCRWRRHNNGVEPMPGFVPPPDHAEDDCFSRGNSQSQSSLSQDSPAVSISEKTAVKDLTKELTKIATPIKERWFTRQTPSVTANTATVTLDIPSVFGTRNEAGLQTQQTEQSGSSTASSFTSTHTHAPAPIEGDTTGGKPKSTSISAQTGSGGTSPQGERQNEDQPLSSEREAEKQSGDGGKGGGGHGDKGGGGPDGDDDGDDDGDRDGDDSDSSSDNAEDDNAEAPNPMVKLNSMKYKCCKDEITMMLTRLGKSLEPSKAMKADVIAVIKLQLQEVKDSVRYELPELCDRLCEIDLTNVTTHARDLRKFKKNAKAKIMDLEVKLTGIPTDNIAQEQRPTTSQGPPNVSTSHLPRLAELKFSGKVEEFPEFKRNWLARYGKLDNDTQMQYLKPSLPPKDQSKVSAVTTMEMCWQRLGKVYGDKQVNLSTVKTNLRSLVLKGKERWEKVLDLHDEVEKAVDQLRVINAVNKIKDDFDLVSCLINKLHQAYQEDWDSYLVDNCEQEKPVWDMFTGFLADKESRAMQSKMRMMSSKSSEAIKAEPEKPKAGKAQGRNSEKGTVRTNLTLAQIKTRDELNKFSTELKKSNGPCPCCSKHHTFDRNFQFGTGKVPTRRLSSCQKFLDKTVQERGAFVESIKACYVCLDPKHEGKDCRWRSGSKCTESVSGNPCGEIHHKLLHNCGVAYCHNTRVTKQFGAGNVMFEVQEVDMPGIGTPAIVLHDGCSNASLITHDYARSAKFKGELVRYYLQSTGYPKRLKHTTMYRFNMQDRDGQVHDIEALGIDAITDIPAQPGIQKLKYLFPQAPAEAFERPVGKVDVLLAANYRELQPAGGLERDGCQKEGLRLAESKFGCGWVISGMHKAIHKEPALTHNAKLLANAVIVDREDNLLPSDSEEIDTVSIHLTKQFQIPDFFAAEDLGVTPAKRCGPCNRCQECDFRRQNLTKEENEVVQRQEELLTLNEDEGVLEAKYAFTEDVLQLKDNIGQAVTFQKSIEKKLLKNGELEAYNGEVQKLVDKGYIAEMTPDEIERTKDLPTSYITHHPVYKESKSTPIRLVTNSSLKNKTCGLSPNQCMGKPPNALSSLLEVFLRWRTFEVALLLDLTKAYQSIKTPGDLERNVRRLLWRWGKTETEWKIYWWQVVTFGDLLASLTLELAKNRAATLGDSVDKEAADLLRFSMYVDDLLGGGTWEQVSRFRGERNKDGSFGGTLAKILYRVGLTAKMIVVSGECDPEILKDYGGKVLGHMWDPQTDKLSFTLPVNLSERNKKGERTSQDLTLNSIPHLPLIPLTKRNLLAFTMGIFDPTGMLSPITVKLKLELRKLFKLENSSLGWDDPVPDENHKSWERLLAELIEMPVVTLPRSVKPHDSVGDPELFTFFDGSTDAYSACVYVRWKLDCLEDEYFVRLIASKARVTAIRGSTTPRSELSGLLIATRLCLIVVRSMSVKPNKVYFVGDSQCTIAALEKSGDSLGPYFCNRVSEICQNFEEIKAQNKGLIVEPVLHVSGKQNPADIATRDSGSSADLTEDSEWFQGPDYLRHAIEDMPLNRDFIAQAKNIVPTEELRTKRVTLLATRIEEIPGGLFNLARSTLDKVNSLDKVVSVFARVMKAYLLKDRARISDTVSAKEIKIANNILYAASMAPTEKAVEGGQIASLRPFQKSGIYFTQGRPGPALENLLGCGQLPILMPDTRMAELIMWQCHAEDHRRNPLDALARSRDIAWIVRGRRLAKTVCARCPRCRLLRRKTENQLMSDIPKHQLKPCPPFTNISLDFMGPFKVKGLGNQRAKIKVYGLVIVCQNTRAVKALAVPGYDTGTFLNSYRKFTNDFGTPELVVSDQGSQLVKASKIIDAEKTDLDSLDWNNIQELTAKSGTQWKFVEAGCQWRNGLVERQVGCLKKTLQNTLDVSQNLNIAELDTLFSTAAFIVNQRPLAVQTFSQDDYRSITPNDLLLGRSKVTVSPGNHYEESNSIPLRLQYIDDLETLWWRQWLREVFPSLIPFKKWKAEHRNMQVGDIVLVLYASKVAKSDYRLARVTEVHPDVHGTVRTVTVSMRPRDAREKVSQDPPHLANKPLAHLRLGVQRVVVVQPAEEQVPTELTSQLTPPDSTQPATSIIKDQ